LFIGHVITGRNPFKMDENINYDMDSEEEYNERVTYLFLNNNLKKEWNLNK